MKKEERKAIFMFRNKRGIINYNLDLKTFARQNRQNPTRAENKIWQEILNNKKTGYKFQTRPKFPGKYRSWCKCKVKAAPKN